MVADDFCISKLTIKCRVGGSIVEQIGARVVVPQYVAVSVPQHCLRPIIWGIPSPRVLGACV